ncbi:hypothetical protein BpHYR1_022339 [Brachionus plicatilis]|uniref:Uncharacterized protein n=1 Tax=Brachionus plicatilis TaxID=10195 RepID=A0A3M7T393_BRAPC|nr:hypothetical protein BpHYR1_022339 [Brachionus plicatilis]
MSFFPEIENLRRKSFLKFSIFGKKRQFQKILNFEMVVFNFSKFYKNYLKILKVYDAGYLLQCYQTGFEIDGKQIVGLSYSDRIKKKRKNQIYAKLKYEPRRAESTLIQKGLIECLKIVYSFQNKIQKYLCLAKRTNLILDLNKSHNLDTFRHLEVDDQFKNTNIFEIKKSQINSTKNHPTPGFKILNTEEEIYAKIAKKL